MSDVVDNDTEELKVTADLDQALGDMMGDMGVDQSSTDDSSNTVKEKVKPKEEKKPDLDGAIDLIDEKVLLSDRKKKEEVSDEDKKKSEEAAAAAKKEEDEIPEELPSGEQERRDGWRNVKKKNTDLKTDNEVKDATIAEKDTRISELEKQAGESSAASPEFQAIIKERDELAETLKKVSFRDSPEFVNSFELPMKSDSEAIDKILKDNGIEGINAKSLLSKPLMEMESKIAEISEDLGVLSKDAFLKSIINYKQLEAGRGTALDNAEEYQKNVNAQNQFNSEKAFMEVTKLVEAAETISIDPDDPEDAADVESAKAYNEAMAAVPGIAQGILSEARDDHGHAAIAYEAAQFRSAGKAAEQRYIFEINQARTMYNDLGKKYNALLGKNPSLNSDDSQDLGGKQIKKTGDAILDLDNALGGLGDRL